MLARRGRKEVPFERSRERAECEELRLGQSGEPGPNLGAGAGETVRCTGPPASPAMPPPMLPPSKTLPLHDPSDCQVPGHGPESPNKDPPSPGRGPVSPPASDRQRSSVPPGSSPASRAHHAHPHYPASPAKLPPSDRHSSPMGPPPGLSGLRQHSCLAAQDDTAVGGHHDPAAGLDGETSPRTTALLIYDTDCCDREASRMPPPLTLQVCRPSRSRSFAHTVAPHSLLVSVQKHRACCCPSLSSPPTSDPSPSMGYEQEHSPP